MTRAQIVYGVAGDGPDVPGGHRQLSPVAHGRLFSAAPVSGGIAGGESDRRELSGGGSDRRESGGGSGRRELAEGGSGRREQIVRPIVHSLVKKR